MKKILTGILILSVTATSIILTSCGKEASTDNKAAAKRTTPIEQVPGKAINKAQNAYDSANKEIEKALQ